MREVKFRAWDGKSLHYVGDVWESQAEILANFKTIEQFTGLLDKNGVEIYEGDVLSINGHSVVTEWREKNACFTFATYGESDKQCSDIWFAIEECQEKVGLPIHYLWEVIGNIHENPELIS